MRNEVFKRAIFFLVVLIISFSVGYFTGNSRRTAQYRDGLTELRELYTEQGRRNSELERLNLENIGTISELRGQLISTRAELEQVDGIISRIGEGFTEDARTAGSLADRIRIVRKEIEAYQSYARQRTGTSGN